MTRKTSRRALPIAAIAGAVALMPMIAFAGMLPGDSLGKSEADVRAALTQQGYSVGDVETEFGSIQAEVTVNGNPLEVTVDRDTGRITAIEQDDRDHAGADGQKHD